MKLADHKRTKSEKKRLDIIYCVRGRSSEDEAHLRLFPPRPCRRHRRRRSWRWSGVERITLSVYVVTTLLASWSDVSASSPTSSRRGRSSSTQRSWVPGSPTTQSCSLSYPSSPPSRWPWSGTSKWLQFCLLEYFFDWFRPRFELGCLFDSGMEGIAFMIYD